MLLRNSREPFDEIGPFDPADEVGANWIEYYERHGYVELGENLPAIAAIEEVRDALAGLEKSKRGKKDQPPADLADPATDLSKEEN